MPALTLKNQKINLVNKALVSAPPLFFPYSLRLST